MAKINCSNYLVEKIEEIAELVAKGELDITKVVTRDSKKIADTLQPVIDENINKIRARRARRVQGVQPVPARHRAVTRVHDRESVLQARRT